MLQMLLEKSLTCKVRALYKWENYSFLAAKEQSIHKTAQPADSVVPRGVLPQNLIRGRATGQGTFFGIAVSLRVRFFT